MHVPHTQLCEVFIGGLVALNAASLRCLSEDGERLASGGEWGQSCMTCVLVAAESLL